MTRFGWVAGKPFYVVSRMWLEKTWYLHNNQHIYIRDRLDKSNKMYTRNKWFFDHKSKTIRNSDWNSKQWAVDARGALRMHNIDSRWYQMFDYRDGYIEIEQQNNQVLTVQHHQDINDRHIVREGKHKDSQDW
jgi:hypothetical protein